MKTNYKKVLGVFLLLIILFSSYMVPGEINISIELVSASKEKAVQLSALPIAHVPAVNTSIVKPEAKKVVKKMPKDVEPLKTLGDYEIAMLFLKGHEGLRYKPYWDVSQWTVGWGTRSKKGETIDLKEANKRTAEEFERVYNSLVKRYPNTTRWQRLVLTIMDYNVGDFGPSLDKAIRSGDNAKIAKYMKRYNKNSKGKYMVGLDKRRKAEAELLLASTAKKQAIGQFYKKKVKKSIFKANNQK